MYSKTTHGISVTVEPFFLSKQHPNTHQYVWAYRVLISNTTEHKIIVKSRYWYVMDIQSDFKEVNGDGVAGERPEILSNESYEYMSGVSLHSPQGMMMGHYNIVNEKNEEFCIEIPAFLLECEYLDPIMN
jgi:ApaG protein